MSVGDTETMTDNDSLNSGSANSSNNAGAGPIVSRQSLKAKDQKNSKYPTFPTLTKMSRMKMCGRCRKAKYCSKLCQVSDWRSGRHKKECQFLDDNVV